jgi:N-ethylmaleimide reductase
MIVMNGSITKSGAITLLSERLADLVSFGKPFVANPDLVRRLRDDIPLAIPDPNSLYQGGLLGYIDYPPSDGGAQTL